MARPRKVIDVEQLKKVAERQWSNEMIAAFFNVDRKTIERRFSPEIEEGRQRGRAKLVDLLWARAHGNPERNIKGSDRILEHVSNRYLGPVKTILKIEAKDLPDEEIAKIAMERLEKRKQNGQGDQ
jgi:hypothetical protein